MAHYLKRKKHVDCCSISHIYDFPLGHYNYGHVQDLEFYRENLEKDLVELITKPWSNRYTNMPHCYQITLNSFQIKYGIDKLIEKFGFVKVAEFTNGNTFRPVVTYHCIKDKNWEKTYVTNK